MNYLIHTGSGLGDIIQFISMARAIKEYDVNSKVDLLMCANKKNWKLNMQILELQEYVNNLYWYSVKEPLHNIKLIFCLNSNHYDYGFVRIGNVNGKPSLWIYRIMRMSGCKKIVGCGTDKVDIQVNIPERTHYLVRNELMLNAIGIPGRKDAVTIKMKVADIKWLKKQNISKNDFLITLSIGTNSMQWKENGHIITYNVKSWSYKNWIILAEKISEKGYKVVLIGGTKEFNEIETQGLKIPENLNIINLIGKTTIAQSFSILIASKLVVGAEGGMMHCASAVGTKTLTVFGGSDYKMWNPGGVNGLMINMFLECSPCFCTSRGANCKKHECLNSISVEMVYNRIIEICEEL